MGACGLAVAGAHHCPDYIVQLVFGRTDTSGTSALRRTEQGSPQVGARSFAVDRTDAAVIIARAEALPVQ